MTGPSTKSAAPNPPREPRPVAEVEADLRELLRLLLIDCSQYDRGEFARAKSIANALYQFFYASDPTNTRGNVAIAEYLLKVSRHCFFTTIPPIQNDSIAEAPLTRVMTYHSVGPPPTTVVGYVPCLSPDIGQAIEFIRLIPFSEWWNENVLLVSDGTKRGEPFSRKDVVRCIADEAGGRHTGVKESQRLALIRKYGNMGMGVHFRGKDYVARGVERACIRQIAHEALLSLLCFGDAYFRGRDYCYPSPTPPPDFDLDGAQPWPESSSPEWRSGREWLRYYAFTS